MLRKSYGLGESAQHGSKVPWDCHWNLCSCPSLSSDQEDSQAHPLEEGTKELGRSEVEDWRKAATWEKNLSTRTPEEMFLPGQYGHGTIISRQTWRVKKQPVWKVQGSEVMGLKGCTEIPVMPREPSCEAKKDPQGTDYQPTVSHPVWGCSWQSQNGNLQPKKHVK